MALFHLASSRKLRLLFCGRYGMASVSPFEPPYLCSLRALFSTHKLIGEEPLLVRDFIHTALYDPKHGYFSERSRSVGVLDKSIKFNQLEGRKAYMNLLDKIYKQSDISWFTPVELFKPWYAHGIAEAILRTTNLSVPLKIYEIGGGSGICAKGILDYIMLNAPERIYNNMTYTSIEISSSLAEIQKETVAQVGSHLSKFRVERRDASDPAGWGDVEQQPCWVIMLEVLDNLPHDLVYSKSQVSPWMEVWVEKKPDSDTLSELYKPLQDPLVKRCIEIVELEDGPVSKAKSIWSKILPKPRRSWLPTGCLKLLEVLHDKLPKMSLIASDFSYLPDVKVPGERAPLVSTKVCSLIFPVLRHPSFSVLLKSARNVWFLLSMVVLICRKTVAARITTVIWKLRAMQTYFSRPTSGFWSAWTITAPVGQRRRKTEHCRNKGRRGEPSPWTHQRSWRSLVCRRRQEQRTDTTRSSKTSGTPSSTSVFRHTTSSEPAKKWKFLFRKKKKEEEDIIIAIFGILRFFT